MKMLITNIQRFSVRDGPGIRTTAFVKGCNLRCKWCHNPETLIPQKQIQYYSRKCLHCGLCKQVCPNNCFKTDGADYDPENCILCGKCSKTCPSKALVITGEEWETEDLAKELVKDKAFFKASGGGVTISGGEPLLQEALGELLAHLGERGVHRAVDTALNVPWEVIERILDVTDLWLVDIKAMDQEVHKKWTGVANERILENIVKLVNTGARIWFRTPVIPGANIDELPAIADFIRSLPQQNVGAELVPFHNYALSKYQSLNMKYAFADVEAPTDEEMAEYLKYFHDINMITYN